MISCVWFYGPGGKEIGGDDGPDKLQGLFTDLIKSPLGPPQGVDTHRHLKATCSPASGSCWQLLIKPGVDWCDAQASTQMKLDGPVPADVIMQMFLCLSNR